MAKNPLLRLRCLECREMFETRRTDQYFCCPEHRKTWNNRASVRGAQLYHFAMQWRAERGEAGKMAMSELCHHISRFLAEDKADDAIRYSRMRGT